MKKDETLRRKVMKLRSQGKSFNEIARELNRTPQRIHQIVRSEQKRD